MSATRDDRDERLGNLVAWLVKHHGRRCVERALDCGDFCETLAIAAELGDADGKYLAARTLASYAMDRDAA